jgi:zona occludens toxin (predicted ATPase)
LNEDTDSMMVADRVETAESVSSILRDMRTTLEGVYDHLATAAVGAVSHVQIEEAAKGAPRITVKSYVSAPLSRADVDQAIETFAYARREIERQYMNQWADTLESLTANAS